jgi:hypothetical protein
MAKEEAQGFVEDVKLIPEDLRGGVRATNERMERAVEQEPRLWAFLELRTALLGLALAFVVALLVHFLLGPIVSVLVFIVLVPLSWILIGRRVAKNR